MISFDMLSPLLRAFFALWGFMLCLSNIGSAVLAVVKKRLNLTACAVVLFAPAYFMWQVLFDFYLLGATGKAAAITKALCGLPWIYWLGAFSVLTILSVLLLGQNIRYDRTFITPRTIKLYLDKVPCGICCWRDNGRVLFSNICMNELCIAITDSSLLNGNHFYEAVKDGIINVEGNVWRFVRREITMDGERLYEMIATDITSEYAKTQALERDKAEMSRFNKELKEYYQSIDESVRRQEILQAKMNIHDEMNRLMLSTMAAEKDDAEALNKVFLLWEQNALLLCMEADKKSSKQQSDSLQALADALGIRLIQKGALPSVLNDKQKELFLFTAQEAVVNAVKHAHAKEIIISFEQTDDSLICRFTNNGILPSEEVRFEGGLANLAQLAQNQSAALYTELNDNFSLVLKYQPIG